MECWVTNIIYNIATSINFFITFFPIHTKHRYDVLLFTTCNIQVQYYFWGLIGYRYFSVHYEKASTLSLVKYCCSFSFPLGAPVTSVYAITWTRRHKKWWDVAVSGVTWNSIQIPGSRFTLYDLQDGKRPRCRKKEDFRSGRMGWLTVNCYGELPSEKLLQ